MTMQQLVYADYNVIDNDVRSDQHVSWLCRTALNDGVLYFVILTPWSGVPGFGKRVVAYVDVFETDTKAYRAFHETVRDPRFERFFSRCFEGGDEHAGE